MHIHITVSSPSFVSMRAVIVSWMVSCFFFKKTQSRISKLFFGRLCSFIAWGNFTRLLPVNWVFIVSHPVLKFCFSRCYLKSNVPSIDHLMRSIVVLQTLLFSSKRKFRGIRRELLFGFNSIACQVIDRWTFITLAIFVGLMVKKLAIGQKS